MREHCYVCPKCGKYNKQPARERIQMIADEDSFEEMWKDVVSHDPLDFPEYKDKYKKAQQKSGEKEGVICGVAKIGGISCCIFVMEPQFMMASMGTVVGDRITALFEHALAHRLPVIGFAASGGARMQEGMLSLIQMAKVSGAIKKHSDAGLLYLVCLTNPTTGGVTASFAMLGDINIAEPEALIGFAGKRVIEQVTKEKLPDDFQSAEFQLKHGFIDQIVARRAQREYLTEILKLHGYTA